LAASALAPSVLLADASALAQAAPATRLLDTLLRTCAAQTLCRGLGALCENLVDKWQLFDRAQCAWACSGGGSSENDDGTWALASTPAAVVARESLARVFRELPARGFLKSHKNKYMRFCLIV
jgi:hypothetical protein